jgi:hypothetical protein
LLANTTTSETVEPAYKKLTAIYNSSGKFIPKGIIGMYFGTLATIPKGWILCDGSNGTQDMRGKWAKITTTVGEIGNTGGSNTHSHAASAHTHAGIAHDHSVGDIGHNGTVGGDGSGNNPANDDTVHSGNSSSTETLSLAAATTEGDSQNNEPPYRTAAFVKLKYYYHGEFLSIAI